MIVSDYDQIYRCLDPLLFFSALNDRISHLLNALLELGAQ